jgi:hypothetical protein
MSGLTRLELFVAASGAICASAGFALGSPLLEYFAVLASVSGVSLLAARLLGRD